MEIGYTWGWRVGEILSRRVRHVDVRKRLIRLDPGETKSGEGRQCKMTAKILELVKECIAGKRTNDFLLTRRGNRPVRDFRKAWSTLCEKSGCPDLLVHDLRRSAARQLRTAGVAESVIMKTAGWTTSSVFRRYAIVSDKDQEAAMTALEERRDAEKARRQAERVENSHSFSHNSALTDDNQPPAEEQLLQ